MRINGLRWKNPVEVTFDDMVVTSTGKIDFDPNLTTHISSKQWLDLYDAMAFALRSGMVMNVHITVVWGRVGETDDNAARELLEKFCAALRHRAADRKYPCSYVYAHERTRDEDLHTHLLTLWPYDERSVFELWVKDYFMQRSKLPVPDLTAVEVSHRRDNDVQRHWLWFGYVTKAAAPEVVFGYWKDGQKIAHRLGDLMLHKHEPGGVVRCRKRVGVSRNLDHTARRDFTGHPHGFSSRYYQGPISSKGELYSDALLQDYETDKRLAALQVSLGSLAF